MLQHRGSCDYGNAMASIEQGTGGAGRIRGVSPFIKAAPVGRTLTGMYWKGRNLVAVPNTRRQRPAMSGVGPGQQAVDQEERWQESANDARALRRGLRVRGSVRTELHIP